MKQTDGAKKQLELLLQRYPILAGQRDEIDGAYQIIAASYEAGGKLLIAGNGGSAADAEHIVGELMKGFKKPRRLDEALAERLLRESPELGPDLVQHLQKALPAIAMDGHPALTTAYANDCAPLMCFAQQVNGYGRAGDVLLVISTSGKRASAQRRSTSSMRCATIPAVRRPSWPNCCTQTRRLSPGGPKIWKGRVI